MSNCFNLGEASFDTDTETARSDLRNAGNKAMPPGMTGVALGQRP